MICMRKAPISAKHATAVGTALQEFTSRRDGHDNLSCPAMSRLQALQAHELGLNSIWDVPWASSAGAAAGSNGTHGSNGNGSSNGKSSLSAAPAQHSGNGNSSGGAASLGGNGKTATSMAAGAADAVAASSGGSSSSNNCQPSGAGEQAVPAPAQEGQEFTTWKFRSSGVAKRTIDYIWYTGAQLVPVSRWRMLSEAEIGPSGLPNTMYPSDHMAVTCQFGWVDTQ
jgi:hypothetical protein